MRFRRAKRCSICHDPGAFIFRFASGFGKNDVVNHAANVHDEIAPILMAASREVDRSLLRWSCSLSIRERLRAATKARRALSGFRRVASEGS
jgi:hypothetical protein